MISPVNFYAPKTSCSFRGATSPEKKAELQRRAKTIKAEIQSAIDEGRKITSADIEASTGLTNGEIRTIFKTRKDINAMWQKVNTGHGKSSPEEREAKIAKVKAVLEDAKSKNIRMTLDELVLKTGVERGALSHYVQKDGLSSLWFWVKTKSESFFSEEEIKTQSAQIKEQLELAIEQKKAITIREIMEATGIEECVIENRIDADEKLTELRDKTLAFEDKNYKCETDAIRNALKEAELSGLKITQAYISDKTGIPVSTVQKRIKQNARLNSRFDKLRAREHSTNTKEEILAQNAQIAKVLNDAIENGQKMSFGEVASKIQGLKAGTVTSRIYNNPELYELWKQVMPEENTPTTRDEIEEQKAKLEAILTEMKEKNEKTTLAKLAALTGITRRVVHTRIQSSEKLSALWEAVQPAPRPSYSKEELEVQDIMIERILIQRIEDKMKPAYSQIGDYLDLAKDTVKQRIEGNLRLLALFKRGEEVSKE